MQDARLAWKWKKSWKPGAIRKGITREFQFEEDFRIINEKNIEVEDTLKLYQNSLKFYGVFPFEVIAFHFSFRVSLKFLACVVNISVVFILMFSFIRPSACREMKKYSKIKTIILL